MNIGEKEEYKEQRATIGMIFLNGMLSSLKDHNLSKIDNTLLTLRSLDLAEIFINEVNRRDELLDEKFPDNYNEE